MWSILANVVWCLWKESFECSRHFWLVNQRDKVVGKGGIKHTHRYYVREGVPGYVRY